MKKNMQDELPMDEKLKHFKVQAHDILALLVKKYSEKSGEYAYGAEVSNATGWRGERWLDFLAIACWPSGGYMVHAFEIKISKSDLRHELENPQKHNIFFDDIDTYTLAAPDFVVDAEMMKVIPKNWGVLAVSWTEKDGFTMKYKHKPIPLHDEVKMGEAKMRKEFAASILRSCMNSIADKNSMENILHEEYERGRKDKEEEYKRTHGDCEYVRKGLVSEHRWMSKMLWSVGIHRKSDADDILSDLKNAVKLYHVLQSVGWSMKNFIDISERVRKECEPIVAALDVKNEDKDRVKLDDIEVKGEPPEEAAIPEAIDLTKWFADNPHVKAGISDKDDNKSLFW